MPAPIIAFVSLVDGAARITQSCRAASQPLTQLFSLGLPLMRSSLYRMNDLISNIMLHARARLGGGIRVTLTPDAPLADAVRQVVEEIREIATHEQLAVLRRELQLFPDQEPGWCLTCKRPLLRDGQVGGDRPADVAAAARARARCALDSAYTGMWRGLPLATLANSTLSRTRMSAGPTAAVWATVSRALSAGTGDRSLTYVVSTGRAPAAWLKATMRARLRCSSGTGRPRRPSLPPSSISTQSGVWRCSRRGRRAAMRLRPRACRTRRTWPAMARRST